MPLETGNMGGVGDFVAALTGRDAICKQAQADAWSRADNIGRAKKTAAEARIAEDEASLRQGSIIADAILNASGGTITPEQAAGAAIMARGGFGNFSQIAEGQSQYFDLGQTRKAAAMVDAGNPDTATLNQVIAVRQRGGGQMTPQTVNPQGLSDALLATERAQAANYGASAEAARRRASAYEYDVQSRAQDRMQDNLRGGSGGGSRGGGSGVLGGDALEFFKTVPAGSHPGTPRVFDQKQYAKFLADWAAKGSPGNINDAARAWVVAQQPLQPIIIDPTNPASMLISPPSPAAPSGAEAIRAQYRAGTITREQAKAQLRQMGYD